MVSLFTLLCVVDSVAAKTIVDFNICEFRETLQLLKLIGIVLNIVKILLPLLIIFMCIKDGYKAVVSGKQDDLIGMLPSFFKRFFAAALIFFAPTIVDFGVGYLVDFDESPEFYECTTCLFDPGNCDIPEESPDLYEEEKTKPQKAQETTSNEKDDKNIVEEEKLEFRANMKVLQHKKQTEENSEEKEPEIPVVNSTKEETQPEVISRKQQMIDRLKKDAEQLEKNWQEKNSSGSRNPFDDRF